jgi:prepilin-type N-terminal cleavage/methylation domain-containing protein/prepilin-type processing-associated H-X9-DG protein
MQRKPGFADVRPAFTLVELLVVIAIIALLIAILLPALQLVKRKAQGTACASDLRQIYIAMSMFANDNKGHLPRPYLVGEMSSDPRFAKVCAWSQKVAGASGHIDMDDGKAALWPYIKGKSTREKVMKCPGDEGEMLSGHPINPTYPRNTSYSLNNFILRDVNNVPSLGLRLASVKQGTTKIMIYEELAPNDSWCIMGRHPADVPSGRHGKNMKDAYRNNPNAPEYRSAGRGNHCFFDGHVESLAPGDLLPPRGNKLYHAPLVTGDPLPW